MEADRIVAVTDVLTHAEEAHGTFEATELGGGYDQEWAQWYSAYAIDHGLGDLLGHAVTPDRLAQFLASSFLEFSAMGTQPGERWATYTARRIVAEL